MGGSKHVALTHVSDDQVAVMGSLSEGGYLHTLSTVYRCTVARASMKTTSHSGKGMFVVDDKLFVCVGNRVMSVKPGPGGLDTVLGKMAVSVSSTKPGLDEESVTVDCVLALLDIEEEAAQLDSLRALVSHELSQPVLSQLLTEKLSLEQTIRLLALLEKLLTRGNSGIEEKVLDWVNILVTGHYLQMVMCKDQEMSDVRSRLQAAVGQIQGRLKTMTDCRVMIKNLLNTKVPPVQISNQI